MRSLGIMQGRLTPSKGRGIQFFPFENWQQEFRSGHSIGISEIEWIFDYDRYEDNPLWSTEGIKAINEIISDTEVVVRSVCFDYFMRRPFYKAKSEEKTKFRSENLGFIRRIINAMKEIGASLIEIPLVDNSSIENENERMQIIDFLHDVLKVAEDADVIVGCETDMPVGVFKSFLDEINHPRVRANYDSGNSSGLGYDHKAEISSLSHYIANVHIKDRVLHGTTVKLGTGSADFDAVFSSLSAIGYDGSIILQAARGDDGREEENIKCQLSFVQEYLEKYSVV